MENVKSFDLFSSTEKLRSYEKLQIATVDIQEQQTVSQLYKDSLKFTRLQLILESSWTVKAKFVDLRGAGKFIFSFNFLSWTLKQWKIKKNLSWCIDMP